MTELQSLLLYISYRNKLSHLGSNLTALGIIEEIYGKKKEKDIFILSSGHAGLALYCVLEKYYGYDAETLLKDYGIHPCKDLNRGICCSTGSLGQGVTVGIGMAIADPEKIVYILCSDGECAEGAVLESFRFLIENPQITNIVIYINFNGYGAYKEISDITIYPFVESLIKRNTVQIINTQHIMAKYSSILNGLSAHYKVLSEEDYTKLCLL